MSETAANDARAQKCAYTECCYLAERLECFGYRADCALYRQSNEMFFSRKSFNEALKCLINKAKARCEYYDPGFSPTKRPRGK